MRRISALLAAVIVAATLTPAGAAIPVSSRFVPGRVLVHFRAGAPRATILRAAHASVVRTIPLISVDVLSTSLSVASAVSSLKASSFVDFAEPDYVGTAALTPNDTCISGCVDTIKQWDIDGVNARAGWDIYPGTFFTQAQKKAMTPVKVALLDTRIDTRPQDWVNAGAQPTNAPWDSAEGGQLDMADYMDFLTSQNYTGYATYHGTFVAGILGAATNNQLNIAGFAYAAQIMPVTVVDGDGSVTASDLAMGITNSWLKGARVINMSLGLNDYSQTVQNAIYAVTKPIDGRPGALAVAAAGNNSNDAPFYPANMRNVMAVSATDPADRPGTCTNHNGDISVAAPGASIVSLNPEFPNGVSIVACGTSTATPHVSALAALLFAQDTLRSPADVRSIIESSADDANSKTDDSRFAGVDEYYGHGRINFERALRRGLEIRDGLSPLPVVDQVFATIPHAISGSSRITAIGRATSPKTITAAEWFVDSLGAPGTGALMDVSAPDASGTQGLATTVSVPLDMQTGVHRLFVRARDAGGWGAASVAALIVDRAPPKITGFQATHAVPAAGLASQITFTGSDDFSTQASYTITVTHYLAGGSEPVYTSEPRTVAIPGNVQTNWMPALTDAGTYTVTVTLRDQAGNATSAFANVVVA